jgi:TonB-dependent SusC/RagA subfamily outer membrane receptor
MLSHALHVPPRRRVARADRRLLAALRRQAQSEAAPRGGRARDLPDSAAAARQRRATGRGRTNTRVEELFAALPGVRSPGAGALGRIRARPRCAAARAALHRRRLPYTPTSDGLIALNPSDIARIEVLKDAAQTAEYGSRGANGVVKITTKKADARAAPRAPLGPRVRHPQPRALALRCDVPPGARPSSPGRTRPGRCASAREQPRPCAPRPRHAAACSRREQRDGACTASAAAPTARTSISRRSSGPGGARGDAGEAAHELRTRLAPHADSSAHASRSSSRTGRTAGAGSMGAATPRPPAQHRRELHRVVAARGQQPEVRGSARARPRGALRAARVEERLTARRAPTDDGREQPEAERLRDREPTPSNIRPHGRRPSNPRRATRRSAPPARNEAVVPEARALQAPPSAASVRAVNARAPSGRVRARRRRVRPRCRIRSTSVPP